MAYTIEDIRGWTDEYLEDEYLQCCETRRFWLEGPDYDGRSDALDNMEENIQNIKNELKRRGIPIPRSS